MLLVALLVVGLGLGQPVKLADLAIFKASVTSKPAVSVDKFDLNTHIKNVRLCAVSTGILTRKQLSESATLGWTSLAQQILDGKVELSDTQS